MIILGLLALAAVSCDINSYENRSHRNGIELVRYSERVLSEFVARPAGDLDFLLVLNKFQNLSPEEQNELVWDDFRSMVEHYTDTYMRIPSMGMTVDTRGVSISVPGNYWMVNVTDRYRDYYDALGHGTEKRVTCIGEDEYEIMDVKGGKDAMILSFRARPAGFVSYELSGSGSGGFAENEKGLSSKFVLNDFVYKDGVTAVHIRVETFHKGSGLDWCEIRKKKDGVMEYESNLDIESRYPLE